MEITHNDDGTTTVDGTVLRATSTGISREVYDAGAANPHGGWLFATDAPRFDDIIEIRRADHRDTHIASVAVLGGRIVDAWGFVLMSETDDDLVDKRATFMPIFQAIVSHAKAG